MNFLIFASFVVRGLITSLLVFSEPDSSMETFLAIKIKILMLLAVPVLWIPEFINYRKLVAYKRRQEIARQKYRVGGSLGPPEPKPKKHKKPVRQKWQPKFAYRNF